MAFSPRLTIGSASQRRDDDPAAPVFSFPQLDNARAELLLRSWAHMVVSAVLDLVAVRELEAALITR